MNRLCTSAVNAILTAPKSVTSVTVYTNEPSVELFANGKSIGVQKRGEFPFFYFSVPNEGETVLTAKAGDCTDESRHTQGR